MNDRISRQLSFLAEIDKLKKIIRQTALTDVSRQENTAEHSWHIALMAIVMSEYANEPELDISKVVKMLLIHDLVEIDAGDTFLYSNENPAIKYEKEESAAHRIFKLLPEDQAKDYLSLWYEFESASTVDARFAKAIDAFQPLLLAYHNKGWSWKKHNISKQTVLEKKEPIKVGSQMLWELTLHLLDEAETKGYFPNSSN
jgi:putative hydrolase of HD superfamily